MALTTSQKFDSAFGGHLTSTISHFLLDWVISHNLSGVQLHAHAC
jgi:hypothetical protein